jgi:ABC-type Co2+ transport system permease subunit
VARYVDLDVDAGCAHVHGGAYAWMTFGVVVSLLVGFALMALVFYSSRHGYDEQAGHE